VKLLGDSVLACSPSDYLPQLHHDKFKAVSPFPECKGTDTRRLTGEQRSTREGVVKDYYMLENLLRVPSPGFGSCLEAGYTIFRQD
jgi:hypothetical protein